MALRAGQRVDLVFTVGQRVLERDNILHLIRLIEQRQQPLVLGGQRCQTGFDIGILLGHVLARTRAVHHMHAAAELLVKHLKLLLRNTQDIACMPAACIAGKTARFKIAACIRCHFLNICRGFVEILRFERQIGVQNQLGILSHRRKVRTALSGICRRVLGPAVRVIRHTAAVTGCRRCRIADACSAGGKQQQKCKEQGEQSFFHNGHLVS